MIFYPIAVALCALSGIGDTVVLDFQADWCGPCRAMQPTVQRLEAAGYPVRPVNIDREPQLAARYGVRNIPCLVAVVNGQERGRQVGAVGFAELQQMVVAAGVRPTGSGSAIAAGEPPPASPPSGASGPRWEPTTSPADTDPAITGSFRSEPPSAGSRESMTADSARVGTGATGRESDLASRLLAASVRVQVEDATGHSFGSGTIIDYRPRQNGRGGEALVLSCGHIFRESQGHGAIRIDLFDHDAPRSVAGRLVRYDMQRDVSLVSFATEEPVTAAHLAAADHKSRPGDAVLSIGCDHGREPTVRRSRVTAVNSYLGPSNIQVAGQPAVGRSGGGLFDDQGRVIGICNAADPRDHAGLFADVASALELLDQADLSEVARSASIAANDGHSAAPQPPRMPERMPLPMPSPSASVGAVAGGTGHAGTEIICVVRSGSGADVHNETIVISNPSPELLSRLAAEQRSAQAAFPTSLEVSRGGNVPAARLPQENSPAPWQPHWR